MQITRLKGLFTNLLKYDHTIYDDTHTCKTRISLEILKTKNIPYQRCRNECEELTLLNKK